MSKIKTYYTNPWLTELTTTLVSNTEKEGYQLVVLKENLFYPTGGGQPHDLGSLNGEPILDVFEEAGLIYHVLANPLNSNQVHALLDWNRRFDHMQQHTGQHLLSAIFADHLGYETVSFHLGADYSSIDLTATKLSEAEIAQVEQQVQKVILKNLPINTSFVKSSDLADLPLRKRVELAGDVRLVEIEGVDLSTCSGTHLTATGQLQLLKIIKTEKYKGLTRVYFLVGERAWQDYSQKQAFISSLVGLIGVPAADLGKRWQEERQAKRELERKLQTLQEQLVRYQAQEIVATAENVALMINLPTASIQEAQALIKAILDLGSFYVVVNLDHRLILGHNLSTGLDLGQLVKAEATLKGGQGGGSPTSAQVYFAEQADLEQFLAYLAEILEIKTK